MVLARTIEQTYFNGLSGFYGAFFTYTTTAITVPICESCLSITRKSRWVAVALMVASLISAYFDLARGSVNLALFGLGLAIVVYKAWWFSRLRISTSSDNPTIVTTRSLVYAERLATANDTEFEPIFKPF